VRFGEIAQHNSGKTLDSGRNTGTLHDYITTSNLYWGCFDLANIRQMPIRDEEFEKCSAKKGDLLICEGGEAGRAAVWFYEKDICFQNHIHRARFYCEIDPYYAYRFFEKLNTTGEINQHRKGVGISNMSGKALAAIAFPLPPIAEQHRIVAKVDELMALCDQLETQHSNAAEAHEKLVNHLLGTLTQSPNTVSPLCKRGGGGDLDWQRIAAHFDTLFTTEASIDALKQTLLQLAVMGKLVSQDPNDEPASELTQRINLELCNIIDAPCLPKLYRDKSTFDPIDFHFQIPRTWVWCELQDIAIFENGKAHEQLVTENESFVLVNSSFISNNGDKVKYVTDRLAPLSKGDIAIVMSDVPSGRALVRCFLVTDNDKFTLNQRIGALRTGSRISKRYLLNVLDRNKYYLQHDDGKKQTNLKKIQIMSCPIPLPPLAEQHRIVAKVDELMTICDQLKSRITEANQLQQKLADVLVEQALS
jgi:type I restriction enzyme S subunit